MNVKPSQKSTQHAWWRCFPTWLLAVAPILLSIDYVARAIHLQRDRPTGHVYSFGGSSDAFILHANFWNFFSIFAFVFAPLLWLVALISPFRSNLVVAISQLFTFFLGIVIFVMVFLFEKRLTFLMFDE